MADHALDADVLRRDRQRYQGLVEQTEGQIAALRERADLLQQAVDGFDRLLALAGNEPPRDGGAAQETIRSRRVTSPPAEGADPTPAPSRRAEPKKPAARSAKQAPPPPTSSPAAPEPVDPPAAAPASGDPDAPKGTEALRLVLESDTTRSWALADLLDALGAKGWLPTSRRPEEGVRISLKRLTERGGAVRTDDGRWQAPEPAAAAPEADHPSGLAPAADNPSGPAPAADPPSGTWPPADPPDPGMAAAPAVDAAPADEASGAKEAQPPLPPPPPPALPASFGRPVGGTITEL